MLVAVFVSSYRRSSCTVPNGRGEGDAERTGDSTERGPGDGESELEGVVDHVDAVVVNAFVFLAVGVSRFASASARSSINGVGEVRGLVDATEGEREPPTEPAALPVEKACTGSACSAHQPKAW